MRAVMLAFVLAVLPGCGSEVSPLTALAPIQPGTYTGSMQFELIGAASDGTNVNQKWSEFATVAFGANGIPLVGVIPHEITMGDTLAYILPDGTQLEMTVSVIETHVDGWAAILNGTGQVNVAGTLTPAACTGLIGWGPVDARSALYGLNLTIQSRDVYLWFGNPTPQKLSRQ